MGRALSLDLRERVWKFIEGGGSRRAAARHFRISVSSAVRIAAGQAERGTLEPRKPGRPPGRGKLAPYVEFLVEIGVCAHPASISRVLTRAGLTYKKSRSTPRSASGRTSARRARTG